MKKANKPIRSFVAAVLQSRHYQSSRRHPFAAPPEGSTAKLPGADDEANEHCEARRREKAEDA
jgi:hypothetical protein